MSASSKKIALSSGLTGTALLACGACCVPLLAPALGAIGIGSISAVYDAWFGVFTGVALLGLAVYVWRRQRRKAACAPAGCGCPTKRAEAPIACTLAPDDFKERAK